MMTLMVDQAKLNEVIRAVVKRRFSTAASVSQLFQLQEQSTVSDFPDPHLVLNFELARSDYDRARRDTVDSSGVVLQFPQAGMCDRASRDR